MFSPYKRTLNTFPVISTTYAKRYFRLWSGVVHAEEVRMIRKIVKLPAIACGIAGWTVIIGCLYVNSMYRDIKVCHSKHKYKR